jgi:hypothetical protein
MQSRLSVRFLNDHSALLMKFIVNVKSEPLTNNRQATNCPHESTAEHKSAGFFDLYTGAFAVTQLKLLQRLWHNMSATGDLALAAVVVH